MTKRNVSQKGPGRPRERTPEQEARIAATVAAEGLRAGVDALAAEGISVSVETARRIAQEHGVAARLSAPSCEGSDNTREQELLQRVRDSLDGGLEEQEQALTQLLLCQITQRSTPNGTRQALAQIARMRELGEKRAERERAAKAEHGSRIVVLALPPKDPDD